jgi:hypothetical protein
MGDMVHLRSTDTFGRTVAAAAAAAASASFPPPAIAPTRVPTSAPASDPATPIHYKYARQPPPRIMIPTRDADKPSAAAYLHANESTFSL